MFIMQAIHYNLHDVSSVRAKKCFAFFFLTDLVHHKEKLWEIQFHEKLVKVVLDVM